MHNKVDQEHSPCGARPAVLPTLPEPDLDATLLVLIHHADGGRHSDITQDGGQNTEQQDYHEERDCHVNAHAELNGILLLQILNASAHLLESIIHFFSEGIALQALPPIWNAGGLVALTTVNGVSAAVAKIVATHGQGQDETENPQQPVVPQDMPGTPQDFLDVEHGNTSFLIYWLIFKRLPCALNRVTH